MEKNKDKNSSFVKIFPRKDGTEFDIDINTLRSGISILSDADGMFEKAYFSVSKLPEELQKYADYNDFVSDIYARTEDGKTIAIIGSNTSIEAVNKGYFAGCYIIRAKAKPEKIDDISDETSFGECTHPNRKCSHRKDGKCTGKGFLIELCAKLSDEELNERQEISKAIGEAIGNMGKTENKEERVNHPQHYQHPSGIECITVARHHDFNIGNAIKYLWHAGIKQEQGLSPLDKQIEDLQKAVFYIKDEIKMLKSKQQEQ